MTNTTIFSSFKAPGVRVIETTQGYRALELATHQAVYMIGSSFSGNALTPTQVTSLVDFSNVFGASPSESSVRLFFRNDKRGILYFIRALIASQRLITVVTAQTGLYTVTINGTDVSITATSTPTKASIVTQLVTAINASSVANVVSAFVGTATDTLIVRADAPNVTFTLTTSALILANVNNTPTVPTAADYVYAIENAFDYEDQWSQGFLIAPEAFSLLTLQADRLAVGNAMEALASDANFDWVALVDNGASLTTTQARAEGLLYNSPQGHTSFFFPYVKDLEGSFVPPSAGVAGIATRRFKEEGIMQPPAGAKYPMLGVTDVAVKVSTQEQEELNPLGINIVRNLRNKGVVVWAMRTRSTDTLYVQMPSRIIMNVLNGTLRNGFDNLLFSSIDGYGVLLNAISQTASAVCDQLWRGKALFGSTAASAFEVKCDFENNAPDLLQNGQIILEVYAVTSPALERLLINTIKVTLGSLPINRNQVTTLPIDNTATETPTT